jgi:hypothetical protein
MSDAPTSSRDSKLLERSFASREAVLATRSSPHPPHAVVELDGRIFFGDSVLGDCVAAAGSHVVRTNATWAAAKMLREREHVDVDRVRDIPGRALAQAFSRELGCRYSV